MSGQEKSKVLTYPPFMFINDVQFGKFKYFRCNQLEMDPKVQKKVLEGTPMPVEKCYLQTYTFQDMLAHLDTAHGMKLTPILDYCATCNIVFSHSKEALLHYASHMSIFEHQNITNDTDHKHCNTCKELFVQLNEMMSHFSQEILFHEPLSEEVTQMVDLLTNDEEIEVLEQKDIEADHTENVVAECHFVDETGIHIESYLDFVPSVEF